ncbi:hypothetical protein L873DRAFT_1845940 [Choiromyces venosus 120613-1]|uniref:DDE-1 domain-containing protein n=1 Tax=Choiromyces venosus 120613-1 TaxID=1336337 RepID=A0A3N4JB19_9PEZI|nr:hypothetical protein L873DRAFT_1845940 [Choiromyces venosus 120613-1]
MTWRETKIQQAIETLNDPQNVHSLQDVVKTLGISPSTLHDHISGAQNREIISTKAQFLTPRQEKFQVTIERVWNLNEASFKIRESKYWAYSIGLVGTLNNVSYESSELVTVLELISVTGDLGKLLLIYKEFPQERQISVTVSTSSTAFINSEIFLSWFKCNFTSSDKWQLILLNGHSAYITDEFMQASITEAYVIPIYFPSHMTNVLQLLDCGCFGSAKQKYCAFISEGFLEGLTPSKQLFFKGYFEKRDESFSKRVILGSWKKVRLFPKNIDLAIESFHIQMNRNVRAKNCQNRHGHTHLSDCPDYLNTFHVLSDVHDGKNTTHTACTDDPIHAPPQASSAYSSSQTASPQAASSQTTPPQMVSAQTTPSQTMPPLTVSPQTASSHMYPPQTEPSQSNSPQTDTEHLRVQANLGNHQTSWRSIRMSLMVKDKPAILAELRQSNERNKELEARIACTQERLARAENQLADNLKKQSKKRKRLVNPNNSAYNLLPIVREDPNCPLN